MQETVYRCDATAEVVEEDKIQTIGVEGPKINSAFDFIEIKKEFIPDIPTEHYPPSGGAEKITVFAEGESGAGGSTLYPRMIGLFIPKKRDVAHSKTFGRKRCIEEFGEEFVDMVELAIKNRCVVRQKKDMYD